MNTETIQYTTIPSGPVTQWLKRIRDRFTRHTGSRDQGPANASARQGDLLRSMPLEEKLRLGMYRYMD